MTTFVHIGRCGFGKHSVLTPWLGWRIKKYDHPHCDRRYYRQAATASTFLFRGIILTLLLAASGHARPTDSPVVALASSLRSVWPNLMDAYARQDGSTVPRTSFASSGLLTTQIRHGAPFELFISADPSYVVQLEQLGKTRDKGVTVATGRLSLLAPRTSALASDLSLASLKKIFLDASKKRDNNEPTSATARITIPNPMHAPYGMAARQALVAAELWPLESGRLLVAENAAQTLQFVLSGAVDAAIVPSSLVTKPLPTLAITELADTTYDPVVHQMVLMKSASSEAEHLYSWLQTDAAKSILSNFGLSAPP